LAESNLFLLSGQGPASLSFNEFNPIFNRNGASAQVSSIVGENKTFGGEVVLAAIQNKLSWSFGATAFTTDGFRKNADQDDKIFNGFAQYELSYKTSIQAEFRYRDIDTGDIELNPIKGDFFEEGTEEITRKTARLGFRHSFSPSSIFLANFSYNETDDDIIDALYGLDDSITGFPPPLVSDVFNFRSHEEAYTAELQHLFRSQYVNTVAGGGYFYIDQDVDLLDEYFWPTVSPPDFLFAATDEADFDIDYYSVYLYSYLNFLENLTFTVGASGDFYDQEEKTQGDWDFDENEFNPKLGITWNPVSSTTLRGAVFRTLKRNLITDQTLEPTQVAGFNQFFDDTNATKAWHYGAAVDQKFSKNIYGGLEGTYRDMKVPFFRQDPPTFEYKLRTDKYDEYLGRAYLYWTPHDWLGLSAEYSYEDLKRKEGTNGLKKAETHAVPLGVNFFHPSGFSCGLKVTYYDQEGKYTPRTVAFAPSEKADDNFWLVDAAVRYRFPKRYGFFTLGVTNLFDEDFNYFDIDIRNPSIQPDRFFFGRVTLALP
jgi:outer membrane receptor for ferrienterochelin and colicin